MSGIVRPAPPAVGSGEWYCSSAYEAAKLVYTGAVVVHSVAVHNVGAATAYLWVFDGTTGAGTPILPPIKVVADGDVSVDIMYGRKCSTGLFVGLSSSAASYSVIGANEAWFSVGYQRNTTT